MISGSLMASSESTAASVLWIVMLTLAQRFIMGGKLPGLRGGPDAFGCSGGNETNGTGCFSTRVMWRTGGAGEGE